MTNFVSFTEGGEVSHVDHLVFNLVDPRRRHGVGDQSHLQVPERPGDRGRGALRLRPPSSTTGPSAPS